MYHGCANCESPRIEGFEHYGPTGVYAPDGYAECRTEIGVRCLDCGAIDDAPALIPEMRTATLEDMLELLASAEVPIGEPPFVSREAA